MKYLQTFHSGPITTISAFIRHFNYPPYFRIHGSWRKIEVLMYHSNENKVLLLSFQGFLRTIYYAFQGVNLKITFCEDQPEETISGILFKNSIRTWPMASSNFWSMFSLLERNQCFQACTISGASHICKMRCCTGKTEMFLTYASFASKYFYNVVATREQYR